jgi:outer membrane protein OmpA-like peptidoglycan-associated protein
MVAQRARHATALTRNRFTRAGYAFTRWNTAANGKGLSYANGVTYAFASSVALYAQWSVQGPVTKPVIGTAVALGPFALKSSVLSPALDAQIKGLAAEIKASKKTNIALVGYGDVLTAPQQSSASARAANFKLSQQRAANVEAYLQQRLAALGVSHYTLFTAGNVTTSTVTSGETAADVAKDGHVIATIK